VLDYDLQANSTVQYMKVEKKEKEIPTELMCEHEATE